MVCDNCPVGRYANHTGEGMRCFECPVGRSTTTREGESSSTGLEQCVRCGKLNGPRGGNFFYQDEMGQPSCKLCRSSGTPGGKNCDEETGATRVGDCWGLYTAASNCKKLQNIYGSVIISFISFMLTVSVLLPFVFLNGGLASVAQVWRRDIVGVTASWMSSTTVKAWKIKLRRIAIREKREREATAEGIFRTIRRRQGRSDFISARPTIKVDNIMGQCLHETIGVGSEWFVALLWQELAADCARNGVSKASLNDIQSLSYLQYRRFLSLLSQRLTFAHDQLRH